MGTHIETTDFEKILKVIDATHDSLRREGNVTRIISTIRIDERLGYTPYRKNCRSFTNQLFNIAQSSNTINRKWGVFLQPSLTHFLCEIQRIQG
jgi:hypothetical protein